MSKSFGAALTVVAGIALGLLTASLTPLNAAEAPQRVKRAERPAPTLWLVWAVEAPSTNVVAADTLPGGEEDPGIDLGIDEWDPQVLTGHALSPALGFLRLPQGGERSWKVLSAVPLSPVYRE